WLRLHAQKRSTAARWPNGLVCCDMQMPINHRACRWLGSFARETGLTLAVNVTPNVSGANRNLQGKANGWRRKTSSCTGAFESNVHHLFCEDGSDESRPTRVCGVGPT